MKIPDETAINAVQIFEARPNRMYTEEQRAIVRFLRYSKAVPCAECGRKSKTHWTLLLSFKAKTMAAIIPTDSGKVHMPLTPVCRNHLLGPAGESR
jgi:hypothetical protein